MAWITVVPDLGHPTTKIRRVEPLDLAVTAVIDPSRATPRA
jgi:hypothetical protein